ncbi:MAG: hypothetical protein GY938_01075 [Ketobacter sp.]|nr:hypothetical protein [Ketobacter sp.]
MPVSPGCLASEQTSRNRSAQSIRSLRMALAPHYGPDPRPMVGIHGNPRLTTVRLSAARKILLVPVFPGCHRFVNPYAD